MSGGSSATSAPASKEAPSRLWQVLPHGVMLAASIFLYWAATRIDVYTGGGTRIGPDAWPKAIIVFMGMLCAFEVVKRLLTRPGGAGDVARPEAIVPLPPVPPVPQVPQVPSVPPEPPTPQAPQEHPRMLAGGIALIAGYAVLVPWVGFFVSTALFLAAFPLIGGLRRPLLASVLGIAGSFLLVVLFMRVAYISLPLGEGLFRALSLGLLELIGVT